MEFGRRVVLSKRDRGRASLEAIALWLVFVVRGGGSLGLLPIFGSIGQYRWRAWISRVCPAHGLCSGGCQPPSELLMSSLLNHILPHGGRLSGGCSG